MKQMSRFWPPMSANTRDGDLILIATGVYTDVSAREGVTQTVYLSKSLTLQGGYTTINWTTPYPITQPTTLDARGRGRVIYVLEGITTTLEGLRGEVRIGAVHEPASKSGLALFTGRQGLANGGTPCIACHSVEQVGALKGGVLGPDLTHVFQRYGGPGLSSALGTLPFPTMQGVFLNKPLDVQEQADLLAYFIQVNQKVPAKANLVYWFWIGGGIGALVFFGLMAIYWPRQRQSLSDRLRKLG